mgnify:CR=1 FL=1
MEIKQGTTIALVLAVIGLLSQLNFLYSLPNGFNLISITYLAIPLAVVLFLFSFLNHLNNK